MLKITKDNYGYYKRIFEIIWHFQAHHAKVNPNAEFSPLIVLVSWEAKGMSLARQGLKAGLNDTLSQLISLPNEYRSDLDKRLVSESFPTLNKLIATIKDTPIKVIKRGKLKNLEEYYIIKEIVDDLSYDISISDREILNKLFRNFEIIFGKKKKNIS